MLSRALILATVILLILVVAPDAYAQNLEAGKSPSQIFAGSCAVCHRSARGLLKTVQPGSLPGFLRDHYTTGRDMATQLSAYLLSNGATDPRGAGSRLTKQGQDTGSGSASEPAPTERQGRRPRPGQPPDAARPDADGLAPDPRTGRAKRNRADPQQQAAPAAVPDGQVAEPAPGRPTQKMGRKNGRGRLKETPVPVQAAKPDVPKPDTQKPDIAPSAPAVADSPRPAEQPRAEPSPSAASTPDPGRPAQPGQPNTAASEPALRPDPVPQVTPAPRPADPEPRSAPAPAAAPSDVPAATPAPAPSDAPPRPTISVTPPPPPPPSPSGPPLPPISQ